MVRVEGGVMRCSRRRRCHPLVNGRETLRELVDTYIQEYRPDAKAELDFFKHKSLEKAVEHAALARDSEKKTLLASTKAHSRQSHPSLVAFEDHTAPNQEML